jgi:hypothetical protein
VVCDGETEVEPAATFPVEKLPPVQLVALADDHESVDDWPFMIAAGVAASEHEGPTAQLL